MKSLLRKKALSTESPRQLDRTLTALDLTFLGIGAVIGTGIFVLTGIVAAKHSGPGIMLSFLIAAFTCACVAFCYAEFASSIPVSGSVYTYAYMTVGEVVAFIVGWCLMLEYLLAVAAVAVGWSGYLQSLLQGFNIHLPAIIASAPGTGKGGLIDLPAVCILLLITGLLSFGIRESARINNIMVLIKLAVIIAFIVAGAKYVKPENWTPFIPFGYDGIITGAATVFFAFLGFDAIATAAEETKKPQRDLPISIIGSLLICTVLYMIVSFVLTGMVPYTQLDVSDPVAFALHFVGEDTIAGLLAVGAMTGMTTVLLVVMYGQVRVSYAMSRDGLLPKALSRVNKKVKIPLLNTWITGVFAALLAGLLDLHLLANLVNIGTLTAFTFVCFAVLILRKTHPDLKRGFRTPLVPALPVVAILCCLYLMTNLSKTTWISFSFWLIVGLCVYFFYSRKHSHLANEKTNDETKEA
ncbi:amino acid permease [Bacillus mycoides]|uniref:amino acid permease n=1 Tax=Bacillus mycoides TaxID=1405 RepID=UPI001A303373|nr:amino acid permease [Bacillus mycoides]MBJ7996289.1 amino acid permease [Bacillus cereus]QWH81981.1 amino acid permease [Bacillus mycoides]QWI96207.1 amino acid permease [Bacillus mycoides]UNJ91608.1 amino acid permease [Bacillus mycoides]